MSISREGLLCEETTVVAASPLIGLAVSESRRATGRTGSPRRGPRGYLPRWLCVPHVASERGPIQPSLSEVEISVFGDSVARSA